MQTLMRLSHLLAACLFTTLLSSAACDDPLQKIQPAGPDCGYELPHVNLSDGQCEPDLLYFRELTREQKVDKPELPVNCADKYDLSRTFSIEAPRAGSPNFALHLYNGTRGLAQIQVFGTTGCGERAQELTKCVDMGGTITILPVPGADEFRQLYAVITYGGNAKQLVDGDFIAVGAYTRPPQSERTEYGGIDPENGLEERYKSCDGESYHRLILSSCNPKANLEAWAAATRLPVSERYRSNGANLLAVNTPPGSSPTKVEKAAVRRKPLGANDNGSSAEVDPIIKHLALPEIEIYPGNDGNSLGQPEDALRCRSFNPMAKSTPNRKENLVIANIDSGVELGGNWDSLWGQYRNRSMKGKYLGDYGYDFMYADRTPEDQTGHGTATAGVAMGSYRAERPVTFLHYKVFGRKGESSYFGALVALYEAIGHGADVVNASWGKVDATAPPALECAIAAAQKAGVVIVTSAGNDRADITPGRRPQWPAAFSANYSNVLTVTSYQYERGKDIKSDPILERLYANFSPKVVSVAGYLTGEAPRFGGRDTYYPFGTSISAPLVTSDLATVLARGGDLNDFKNTWRRSPSLTNQVRGGYFIGVCR